MIGLTSVTFRKKSVEEVIATAVTAGCAGIEWGGDVHVPAGDTRQAARVKQLTEQAGLEVLSYGSYFKAEVNDDIAPHLAAAKALGTKIIRIWAGSVDYEDASERYRLLVVNNVKKAAKSAAEYGMTLCFEFHSKTLCNSAANVLSMLALINEENVKTYWQPLGSVVKNLAAIKLLSGKIENVHVFHWVGGMRKMLANGQNVWAKYLAELKVHAPEANLIMEFVKRDSTGNLVKDVKTLKGLI
jgi:sugar phosphate isomerase/epimerase